ncbi:MAG TPA: hypothetical protein VGQ22_08100, partial [Steroidobacteraceae bacterium]|nr:hypothetical protein [Steroidobacteraceae bacterium]
GLLPLWVSIVFALTLGMAAVLQILNVARVFFDREAGPYLAGLLALLGGRCSAIRISGDHADDCGVGQIRCAAAAREAAHRCRAGRLDACGLEHSHRLVAQWPQARANLFSEELPMTVGAVSTTLALL